MIISHKYRFIFIKTVKTAGTSIEVFLSGLCGDDDVVTPIYPQHPDHRPRNHRGIFNPLADLSARDSRGRRRELRDWMLLRRYYNHMPAERVRRRLPESIWSDYFKFCVERNPWDKTLSHYHMVRDREGVNLSLDDYLARGRFCLNLPLYTNDRGEVLVDRVVRYESLMQDLGEVFDSLGVRFDGNLGVRAKGEHRQDRSTYREVLNDRQSTLLGEVFKEEIALHGYSY